ncbi:MAG: hypothetical protein JRJ12_15220 [Deltaproteobacteria bacterium]|nr:hypothetical protein [Deltaproteobacteria bacterium]MBW2072214.1 hypothetical protein [Deltaproteobacteria bacterium]
MKPAIASIPKWTEKTAQAVKKICLEKNAPCVGFALVFFDPVAEQQQRWSYVIELAFDPHNPPTEEERQKVAATFEFICEGIKRLLGGEFAANGDDRSATPPTLH